MWEISSSRQLLSFLYAVVLGLLFSFVYDILKSYRIMKKSKDYWVLLQDIFYFFTLSVITFIFFLIFTNGEIRVFILLGLLLGFVLWRLTFSSFIVFILKKVFGLYFNIIRFFKRKNTQFLAFLSKIGQMIIKNIKNIKNTLKKA